ncbi:uncharacterized protein LOC127730222 [Mytilus californianus]|uniref:uncharacterized protein LOC127730222 n=1 Tax=Mytilus californianus TaxID=6549 RepID=UPI00224846AF|nr:uncharacterized protein LOC127730222 [Mytilus californianus]
MMFNILCLALMICSSLAVPLTSTTVLPTTLNVSVQSALDKLRHIVGQQVAVLWQSADTNKDGKFTASDMNVIFTDYDHNNDSVITKAEFIGRFTNNQPEMDTIAQGLFLTLDVNQDGTISNHDLELFYQRMDTDHNKHVDQSEFKKYFTDVMTLLFVIQLQGNTTTTTAASG